MRTRDEEKIEQLAKLLEQPRTVTELMERLEASDRSIYRWLGYLDGVVRLGVKNRDVQYQII